MSYCPGCAEYQDTLRAEIKRRTESEDYAELLTKAAQAVVDLDDGDKPDLWHYQAEFDALRAVLAKNSSNPAPAGLSAGISADELPRTPVGLGEKPHQPEAGPHCMCPACKGGTLHASDCAVHNGPALLRGRCDCGVLTEDRS